MAGKQMERSSDCVFVVLCLGLFTPFTSTLIWFLFIHEVHLATFLGIVKSMWSIYLEYILLFVGSLIAAIIRCLK